MELLGLPSFPGGSKGDIFKGMPVRARWYECKLQRSQSGWHESKQQQRRGRAGTRGLL